MPTTMPSAWERELSHERLAFRDGDATARKPWKDAPWRPAALVAVPGRRGGGAAVALTVESMPKVTGYFSFGVGRAMAKVGERFGDFGGTCGLRQDAEYEASRRASSSGFGRRADRDDKELGPEIKQGSRLALRLSERGAEGRRTARFYVDQRQVAVFADIEDDGGSSDWVAGVTLSTNARVRLVPAEGVELGLAPEPKPEPQPELEPEPELQS